VIRKQLTLEQRYHISEVFNLERLLDSIENNVLRDITWKLKEQGREVLLKRYQQLYIYKQPLLVTYQLHNIKDKELSYINRAVSREADIRSFTCEIKMNNVNIKKL